MAVATLPEQLATLLAVELNPNRRYRCLLMQTNDLGLLGDLVDGLPRLLKTKVAPCATLSWDRFFDQVGALSSQDVRSSILAAGKDAAVILSGPLHYVDYWTPGVQEAFWSFLSLFSHGPGVVVCDTPRTDGVELAFAARGALSGTDIRYWRPRLVATEEARP